jgi:ketosteroid isomerase-like protein
MDAEHPNAALGRRLLDAFAASGPEPLAAATTDDVVWHSPGTNRFAGRFDGQRAVIDRFERIRGAGISSRFEIHDVVANDRHVVALVHLHVENASGARYDQPQVQVMHVRDGRIAEVWSMNQDQAVFDVLMGA